MPAKKGSIVRKIKAYAKRDARNTLPDVKKFKQDLENMRHKGRQESIPMNVGRGARKGYDTTTNIIWSDIRGARARRRLKPQFVIGRPNIAQDYGTKNLSQDYGERNLTSGTPW